MSERYTALTFEVTGFKDVTGARQLIFNYEREKDLVQICATPESSEDQNIISEMTTDEFFKWTVDLNSWAFLIRGMEVR